MPLTFDPGTRWDYGINIDLVGKAVERVSGQRLDAYLRDHMFGPLGMNDTGFKLTLIAAHGLRYACARRRRRAGADPVRDSQESGIPDGRRRPVQHRCRLYEVYADDPQKGARQRQSVLRAETVTDGAEPYRRAQGAVSTLRSGVAERSNDANLFPGMVQKWGLGFPHQHRARTGRAQRRQPCLGRSRQHLFLDRSGPQFIAAVVMTQILPFADAKALAVFDRLREGGLRSADLAQRSCVVRAETRQADPEDDVFIALPVQ